MSSILGIIGGIAVGPFLLLIAVMGYVAAVLSSLLLSLGGLLAGVANDLQPLIASQSFVVMGWTIVRDVANLGFVIVIIVIAFATILRMENYNAKKLLPRLIAAAILVNFSLQIGAFVIGFSQIFTDFFLNKITGTGNGSELGNVLLGGFNPQQFWSGVKVDDIGSGNFFSSLSASAVNLAVGPWLTAGFNLIMLFTVLVMAFLFILRFLHLSFLLIIAPITWLFWVIPALQGNFSDWWKSFFKWVFFAPAASFFIYLSFAASPALMSIANKSSSDAGFFANVFMSGVQVILLAGLTLGGLVVAQQLGIKAAGGAMGLVEKAGKGARAWAGRAAMRGATRPLRGEWGGKLSRKMETFGQSRNMLLRTLSRPIREAGIGLSKARMVGEKQVEDAKKRLPKPLDEQARRYNTYDNAGRIAALSNIGTEAEVIAKKHGTREEAAKKRSDAETLANSLKEQRSKTMELDKRSELDGQIAEAEAAAAAAAKGAEAWERLERVLSELPENAREEFEKAGYKVEHTKAGKLYGKRPKEDTLSYVMPSEGKTERMEKLIKDFSEAEAGKEEKKGGDEKSEKKEEKK